MLPRTLRAITQSKQRRTTATTQNTLRVPCLGIVQTPKSSWCVLLTPEAFRRPRRRRRLHQRPHRRHRLHRRPRRRRQRHRRQLHQRLRRLRHPPACNARRHSATQVRALVARRATLITEIVCATQQFLAETHRENVEEPNAQALAIQTNFPQLCTPRARKRRHRQPACQRTSASCATRTRTPSRTSATNLTSP